MNPEAGEKEKEHFCKCGCQTKIEWKPHYKYKGWPDYIRGHHSSKKRNTASRRNVEDRNKDYQNPNWIEKELREKWINVPTLAKQCHVSEKTIRTYMKEGGVNLYHIVEEEARKLEDLKDEYLLAMPGSKNKENRLKTEASFIIRESEDGDETVRKLFVRKLGTCYTSKLQNEIISKAEIDLEKQGNKYKILNIKPIEVITHKQFLETMSKNEIISALETAFGTDITIRWLD